MQNKFPPPVGAMWIRGYTFFDRFKEFLEHKNVTYTESEFKSFMGGVSHTIMVKIAPAREKFIAVENRKKAESPCRCLVEEMVGGARRVRRVCEKCKKPDYFVHVYQTHTGAAPLAPWGNPAGEETLEVSTKHPDRQDDTGRAGLGPDSLSQSGA